MKYFILLFLLLTSFFTSFSQVIEKNDSTVAGGYFKDADSFLQKGMFKEALAEFKKAKSIWDKESDLAKKLWVSISLADCYQELGDLEGSKEILDSVLVKLKNISNDEQKNLIFAKALLSTSYYYSYNGDFNQTLYYQIQCLEVKLKAKKPDNLNLAKLYSNIGNSHSRLGGFDSAIYFQKISLDTLIGIYPEPKEDIAATYHNMGATYSNMGLYENAEEVLLKGLNIREEVIGKDHPLTATTYGMLGLVYQEKGQLNISLDYQKKSLRAKIGRLGPNHYSVIFSHHNLGGIYLELKEFDKALSSFNDALKIEREFFSEEHYLVVATLLSVGTVYIQKEDYEKALFYILEASEIEIQNYGQYSLQSAETMANIGYIYFKKNELDKAKSFFNRSLDIHQKLKNYRHPLTSDLYYHYFELYKKEGVYDSALIFLQKAVIANSTSFEIADDFYQNPSITESLRPIYTMSFLLQKADLLSKLNRKQAISHNNIVFQQLDSMIEISSKTQIDFEDKVLFQQTVSEVYHAAMQNLLNARPYKEEQLNKILYYAEKAKSYLLKRETQNLEANLLIPEKLLLSENRIKAEISYFESRLYNAKLNNESTSKLSTIENKLFNNKRSLDSIKNYLEDNYPKYYQVKYQSSSLKANELRNFLDDHTALIEYVFNDRVSIAILATNNQIKIIDLKDKKVFHRDIQNFRKIIENREISYENNFSEVSKLSYNLYQHLFLPIDKELKNEKHKITDIMVVTDSELNFLPFEALITDLPENNSINYKELKYLIKDYNINYQYSTSLAFQKVSNPNETVTEFVGFAPSFEGIGEEISDQIATRGNKVPLKWNTKEVSDIHQIMGSNNNGFEKEKATESTFKEKALNSKIVHLATHAFIDEEDPMNSKIIFASENDSIEDGALHAFEIYNMNFNTEMVTLSACNTGFGKISEGEGTMSLARAFSYAGVPSVVMSHWEVDDKITSQLMSLFYKNLADGMRKDHALRQAKLQLMDENDPAISDPYFWAAFVVMGDVSPISGNDYGIWYWLGGAIFLLLGVIFFKSRVNA